MIFEGICLITNDVKRLSEFYQKVLQTTSDSDDDIHQEIKTRGAFLSILYCDQATKGNPYMSMAFTVDDVDDEFVRLKSLGIKIIDEPTVRPWGAKNMRFCDPDGNFVVFRSFPNKT